MSFDLCCRIKRRRPRRGPWREGFDGRQETSNCRLYQDGQIAPSFNKLLTPFAKPQVSGLRPVRNIHFQQEEIMTMNCDLFGDNPGLDQPSAELTGDNPVRGGQLCQKLESA